MRLITSIFLIIVFAEAGEHFLPWWSIAIVTFLVTIFTTLELWKAFLSGFMGIFLFWMIVMLFKDFNNGHILSTKMIKLFSVPNPAILMMITATLGGIVGGLASLSAALLRKRVVEY